MSGLLAITLFFSYLGGGEVHAEAATSPCRATFTTLSKGQVSVRADHWAVSAQPVLIGCEEDLRRLDAAARAKLLAVFEHQLESLSFLALGLNKNRAIRERWIVAPLNAAFGSDVISDVFLASLSGTEYEPKLPAEQTPPDPSLIRTPHSASPGR